MGAFYADLYHRPLVRVPGREEAESRADGGVRGLLHLQGTLR